MSIDPDTATTLRGSAPTSAPVVDARRSHLAALMPDALAAGAVLTSGVLLLHWLSRITFWRDEWGILLQRRGWSLSTFLDPAVEHLIALPILIYKILLATGGMDSPRPFQVVGVLTFLLSVVLLYIYVRRRVGAWLALAAILPVLFLGPAWDDLLFPFQMTLFGSVACGIGALFALEQRSRAGDAIATALLVCSLLFSDLGIPFVAGAAVEVSLDRDRARRAFVAVVPTVLWCLWYVGWGHQAHTFISFHNFANLPGYVLNGLASSLATLVGLNHDAGVVEPSPLDWGRPLLVAVIGLVGLRLYRRPRPPARILSTLAILLGFWCLAGMDASPFTLPTVGRYQYIGIVLLLLVAADLGRGLPIRRLAIVAVMAVAISSALANFSTLRESAHGLAGIAQQERGALAGLELARGQVSPSFGTGENAAASNFLGFLDADAYFSAIDAYGSPAYSPRELAGASEAARSSADQVLAEALGISLLPLTADTATGCSAMGVREGAPAVVAVPTRGLILRADSGTVRAALRRFASAGFPVVLGAVPRRGALLRIPTDSSSVPWTLELSGKGRAILCRTAHG